MPRPCRQGGSTSSKQPHYKSLLHTSYSVCGIPIVSFATGHHAGCSIFALRHEEAEAATGGQRRKQQQRKLLDDGVWTSARSVQLL